MVLIETLHLDWDTPAEKAEVLKALEGYDPSLLAVVRLVQQLADVATDLQTEDHYWEETRLI